MPASRTHGHVAERQCPEILQKPIFGHQQRVPQSRRSPRLSTWAMAGASCCEYGNDCKDCRLALLCQPKTDRLAIERFTYCDDVPNRFTFDEALITQLMMTHDSAGSLIMSIMWPQSMLCRAGALISRTVVLVGTRKPLDVLNPDPS